MPVTNTHRCYADRAEVWAKIRDALEGEEAIKAKGETYLPRPSGQDWRDFRSFLARAPFEAAVARTRAGLTGLIFRKPPTVNLPAAYEDWADNLTLDGTPADVVARDLVQEVLATGRAGIITDLAQGENGRPYIRLYPAEHIRNWSVGIDAAGLPFLQQLILEDEVTVPEEDGYGDHALRQLRVLQLKDGVYGVELWQPSDHKQQGDGDEWNRVDAYVPARRGRALDFIPFVTCGPFSLDPQPQKPPLLDVCNLNLAHYRCSADLAHALHMVALPTPWVADDHSAADPAPREWRIGSGTAWLLTSQGKAGMLEVSGAGIGSLSTQVEHLESRMAAAGGRILESQKKDAEAAETVRLRQTGETSILAAIANTSSFALTKALRTALWWAGAGEDAAALDADVQLNTDFFDAGLTGQDLAQMVAAWNAGAFSWEVLMHNLRRGELIPDHLSDEDVRDQLDSETAKAMPPMLAAAVPGQRPGQAAVPPVAVPAGTKPVAVKAA
jgi:hypothetical protein